jgi:hypothetical protein
VREIPIHGGSLRLYAAPAGSRPVEASVESLAAREAADGVADGSAYRGFARRVEALRGELVALLDRLQAEGASLAAYGAAAKGTTLLNYCGIGAEHIRFVADRSPHKQGRLVPGVRIPIAPPERLLEERPDYCLLLAWNLADEILEQQAEYRRAGGRFILPLPEPRLV